MSTLFTKIDHIDSSIIVLFHGYCKKVQKLLPASAYHIITQPIINMMIIYYFVHEYWEKYPKDAGFRVSGVNNCILGKRKSLNAYYGYNNVSYAHQWVPSMSENTFKWTIKVHECGVQLNNRNNGIMIGLVSDEENVETNSVWRTQPIKELQISHKYFWAWADIYVNGYGQNNSYNRNIYFGNKGEVLTVKLDLKRKELIFYINGKSCGVAVSGVIKKPEITYKLAVSMYWPDTTIEIQNFEEIEAF